MDLSRRHLLTGFGSLAVSSALGTSTQAQADSARTGGAAEELPRKSDFAIADGDTYLNCAYIHPMAVASAENVQRYVRARSRPDGEEWQRLDIKAEFAAIINAKPSEIAFIPNTTTGENLIVNGLGLPGSGGNVVTDALHFEGALIHRDAFHALRSPDPEPLTFELGTNATGHFEVGSQANGAWASLSTSLPYIRRLGVENIEAYRQPMLRQLHKEMPSLGFEPLTPSDSKSALITFAMKDAGTLPSVFNDMEDVDRLLEALAG
jgi:selenocysteine lyase/cysteine desulfurase